MKNLIRKLYRHKKMFSTILPFVLLAGILLSGQLLVRNATADTRRNHFQISVLPTPTNTPIPPTPTFTPIPPTATFTPVPNRPPEITGITGPLVPVAVGEKIVISVSFSDHDTGDSHEACFHWGDSTQTCLLTNGSFVSSAAHSYMESGIFKVLVTITDSAGTSDTGSFEFIIVYNPDGGFVTGGGWIYSNVGAYKPNPALTGKANFGFMSQYKKGAIVPTGNAQLKFKTAGLNFKSSSYDWLVVTGNDTAKFKGSGTVNGEVADDGQLFKFIIWAKDSAPDKFRIKIWYDKPQGEEVVYDNGSEQPIGDGSIVIHK
jgi:hypothetical protein